MILATEHSEDINMVRVRNTIPEYDLIVIGSGPAGQKAALAASKGRFHVALVERREVVGGACLHTGTIPSKTLRAAVLYFIGHGQHGIYGESYRIKDRITSEDLTQRVNYVIRSEMDVISDQMKRNGVDMYFGEAHFANSNELVVKSELSGETRLQGKKFIIAVGTRPVRSDSVPFTRQRIIDSDLVTGRDHHFDNLDVGEVADVGHANFNLLSHGVLDLQSATGFGLSGSMPNRLIAVATVSRSI